MRLAQERLELLGPHAVSQGDFLIPDGR
jgi:hypothetical protein